MDTRGWGRPSAAAGARGFTRERRALATRRSRRYRIVAVQPLLNRRASGAPPAAALALVAALAAACPSDDTDEAEPYDAEVARDAADEPADADVRTQRERDFVPCPADGAAREDPDVLFDLAGELLEEGAYAEAKTCAELAADWVPRAVEAHHVRALAAAALGMDEEAEIAFARALAYDPNDPETLIDAADYYLEGDPGWDAAALALAYAERGTESVREMWREDESLLAELEVRRARANRALNRPGRALELAERAASRPSAPPEALFEKGAAHFHRAELDDAEAALETYTDLEDGARDARSHFLLAVIYERRGDADAAQASMARAAELSGGELGESVDVSPAEFEEDVEAAVRALPEDERALLEEKDVEITVEDRPERRDLEAAQAPLSPAILGLYRGAPAAGDEGARPPAGGDAEGAGDGTSATAPPEREIVLYRENLTRESGDREELAAHILDTIRHEIGHLGGLSEADLRRRGLD